MRGTDKQITWATEILTRYNAAREVVMAKVSTAPEANRQTIINAVAKIDAKLNDQAYAGDIIARGQVYFTGSDRDVPALMDAIRTIAKGHDTVLNAD